MNSHRVRLSLGVSTAAGLLAASAAFSQTQVKPGWNLFSPEQDIEIGRQSAAEAERQLPLLNDSSVERYMDEVGRRLAAVAPGPKFPYQFRVANLSDINAFALPGGFLYINRGLIEATRNEGELAGVMAHEVAHVALRHSTANVSKAYLAQAGVGILGGLLGGESASTRGIIEAVGGFGLNALFLKYSRTAEEQADIVGTQILARAGYDPMAMASMFQMLNQNAQRQPSKLENFFSSHPPPANREARVRNEAGLVGGIRTSASAVGGLDSVQANLRRLPPAPTMAQVAKGVEQGQKPGGLPPATGTGTQAGRIERPSTRYRTFRHETGLFQVQHPDNWSVHGGRRGQGVTIVPRGGVVQSSSGQQTLLYGVIINHYDPFEGTIDDQFGDRDHEDDDWYSRRDRNDDIFSSREDSSHPHVSLEQASHDLIDQLTRTNPYLRPVKGSQRRQTLDGAPALSIVLAGRSPVSRQEERATVFTRQLPDGHILYSLFVAPSKDYKALSRTFQRMVSSLDVSGRAAH